MSKAIVGAAELGAAVAMGALAMMDPAVLASPMYDKLMASLVIAGVSSEAGAIADALTQNRGMGITTRQPAAFRQIVYGTQRIPGTIVYESTTGGAHDQYNFVIVLATHQIDAIQNLYLDGRRVYWQNGSGGNVTRGGYNFGGSADSNQHAGPDGQHYNFGSLVYCEARFGDQLSGDVISGLTANDPNWTGNANGSPYLGGCAYVYLKVEYDRAMFPQVPEIRFTVNGKNNIWDPRSSTSAWTDNWALIVADMITDATWGLGDNTVNQAQLIAAANVCDEQIGLAQGVAVGAAGSISSIPIENRGYAIGSEPTASIAISGNGTGASATCVITQVGTANGEPVWALTGINVSGGSGYTSATATLYTWGWENPPIVGTPVIAGTQTSSVTERQDTAHWHYDTSISPGDALQTMMAAAAGRLSRVGGEWYIYPASWLGVSFTFDENALVGPITWVPKRSVADLINRVTGTYIAPNYPYSVAGNEYDTNGWYNGTIQNNFPFAFMPTNYPAYACDQLHGYGEGVDVYLTQDGGIPHPRDINQQCVLSVAQAQRLAKIFLLRNRQQGSGVFPMALSGWQMEPGDIMQFNLPSMGWVNKYLEVVSMRFKCAETQGRDGRPVRRLYVEAAVQETDPSVYEWAVSEELTVYDVPAAAGAVPYIVPPPTGLTIEDDTSTASVLQDGSTIPRVLVTWTPPTDTYVNNGGAIEVQYQLSTSSGKPAPTPLLSPIFNSGSNTYTSSWVDVGKFSGISTYCFIDGINQAQYQNIAVRVRALRASGAASVWVQVGTVHSLNFLKPRIPIGRVGDPFPIFVFQDSGNTLDGLEPAEAGADVTAHNGGILLQNANFLRGNLTGWTYPAGWAVAAVTGTDATTLGSGWCAQYTGTGSSAQLLNAQQVPCNQGDIVAASCFAQWGNANGTAQLLINWYSHTGSFLSQSFSAAAPQTSGVWTRLRVVGTAPATAAYALIGPAVFNNTNGSPWNFGALAAALQPNSLDEVPDGTTYQRVAGVSGNLATTSSLAASAVNESIIQQTTTYVPVNGGPVQIASATITPSGGYVKVRVYGMIASTNSVAVGYSISLYRGDNTGTLLAAENYGTFPSPGSSQFVSVALEGLDTGPGTSPVTYTAYASTNASGTANMIPVILIVENCKR